eukprot:3699909-Amphidinium_carterae.1
MITAQTFGTCNEITMFWAFHGVESKYVSQGFAHWGNGAGFLQQSRESICCYPTRIKEDTVKALPRTSPV